MALMLVAVLVLSLGAFIFTDEEAWAQQQRVEVTKHVVVNGEEVAEPAIGRLPTEDVPVETPLASTPSLDLPPADRFDPGTRFELAPPTSGPFELHEVEMLVYSEPAAPVPGTLDQYGSETSVEPNPTPAENLDSEPVPPPEPEPAFTPAPASGSLLDSVSEPIAFEENEALPSYVGEASESSLPYPKQEESYSIPGWETAVNSAVKTLENAGNVLGDLTDGALFRPPSEDEYMIGAELVDPFSGGEVGLAPTGEGNVEDTGPSGGMENSRRDDAPQPASPFAPLPMGDDSYSLVGVGEVGPGGATPVLLCVLVPVLLLLRRDRGISWAFCDFSKPSSALLLPLERPG